MNFNATIVCLKLQLTWISIVTGLTNPNEVYKHQSFQAGIRVNISSSDLIKLNTEYWRCIFKCQKRPSCTAVSYHGTLHLCYLSHQLDPPVVESKGYVFSRKSDWPQESYTWCSDRCEAGHACDAQRETCDRNECPWPESPNNGAILGNNRRRGDKIAYLCNKGFMVHKRSSRKCKGGDWQGVDPVCQQKQSTLLEMDYSNSF